MLSLLSLFAGSALSPGLKLIFFWKSVYQLGTPVIGLGLLLLSFNLLKSKIGGYSAPVLLISSILIGLVSMAVASEVLFMITGLLFGMGFIMLGVNTWLSKKH